MVSEVKVCDLIQNNKYLLKVCLRQGKSAELKHSNGQYLLSWWVIINTQKYCVTGTSVVNYWITCYKPQLLKDLV